MLKVKNSEKTFAFNVDIFKNRTKKQNILKVSYSYCIVVILASSSMR